MYRLGELTDKQRFRIGSLLVVAGSIGLAVAVILVHYAGLPERELVNGEFVPVVVDYFNWVPRGWLPKSIGYVMAFGASQMLVGGAAVLWVLNQKMTWARSAFAAFLAWIELVIFFGIVPSEWLNLTQTDLDWSSQRIAFTIPPILVLGNEVSISWAAIKDAVSMGYHMVMLGAAAVFAYKLQDIGKGRPAQAAKPLPKSPYGRPLMKGGG